MRQPRDVLLMHRCHSLAAPPLVHVQETHLSWNPVHGGGQQWTWALQGGSKQRQDPTHPIRPLASALSNTQMKWYRIFLSSLSSQWPSPAPKVTSVVSFITIDYFHLCWWLYRRILAASGFICSTTSVRVNHIFVHRSVVESLCPTLLQPHGL